MFQLVSETVGVMCAIVTKSSTYAVLVSPLGALSSSPHLLSLCVRPSLGCPAQIHGMPGRPLLPMHQS